jgi:hypothetical protein
MVQQTQEMGRLALQSACGLVNGEDVPPEQLQEAFLLTKDDQQKAEEYLTTHP